MRQDVPWCPGSGEPPVDGTVINRDARVVRQRGRCPECDRLMSCPKDKMSPHGWSPKQRSTRQVFVEDRR